MDFEQLIENYQPTPETVDLVRSTKIVLLVGIAGAGKDTIKKELLSKNSYQDIISHTTRAPRSNNGMFEVDGHDYHFIDRQTAEEMVLQHKFIEVKFVHNTVYGTSANELQKAHDQQKIATTDIDVQGVDEYKALSSDVIAIFILPPDYSTWRKRLAQRYSSSDEFSAEWPKRRLSAIAELTHALEVPYYHFIVNDELDRAVRVVDEIAQRDDMFNRHDDEARLKARDILDAIQKNG